MSALRDYLIWDTSQFPLVRCAFQDFVPTGEEFRKWQLDVEAFNESHENCVVIVDFSKVQIRASEYRIDAARWVLKNDAVMVRRNIKTVFYTPSLIIKVMMKAIMFMAQPRAKYYLVTDLDKGYAWAKKQLADTVSPVKITNANRES